MEKASFLNWLDKALTFFDRKGPSEATVSLWFEAIKNLPDGCLDFLYDQLGELENFPRNLPGFMKSRAAGWHGGQQGGECECHDGFWEVARYRKELREWAIFKIVCGNCTGSSGGPKVFHELLWEGYYQKEPSSYAAQPNQWAFIYPDKDSLEVKVRELKNYLANRKPKHEEITADDLQF